MSTSIHSINKEFLKNLLNFYFGILDLQDFIKSRNIITS